MESETVRIGQRELAQLLREAERAHGEYETTLGHRDEDWPSWYATYIVGKLKGATGSSAPTRHRASTRKTATPKS